MASTPYDVQTDWRGCYDAQWTPLESLSNTDMDGIAVAVANVIVNLCLPILMVWSSVDVELGFQASLLQFYPVLLSALLSITRGQLSLFDANYALLLSSSPLAVYLISSTICDLFGIKNDLSDMMRSHRRIIRLLGALFPFLWLGLSLTIGFSTQAFKDSELCRDTTFNGWFWNLLFFFLYFLQNPGDGYWCTFFAILSLLLLCLLRRLPLVMEDLQARRGGTPTRGIWCTLWTFAECAWCTLDRKHKWCKRLPFLFLDIAWAYQVIYYAVAASGKKYVLTYGQLLPVFAAVPPLISTLKVGYTLRWDLLHFVRQLPSLLLAEVVFLLTGIESGPPTQDSHLPFNITSYPQKPTPGKLCDRVTERVRSTDKSLLSSEPDPVMKWKGGKPQDLVRVV